MKKTMKNLLMMALAVFVGTPFAASAVNVTKQSELESALKGSDKNITITKSFTTSKNLTIPAGFAVRLANGVVLTLGYSEGITIFGATIGAYSYKLSGDGVIVTGDRKVVTKEVRTLPTVGGTNNRFAGMTYEVTTVESTGGSVSYTKADQLSCKCTTGVSVDGGESWNYVENAANAVVCTVSSGVNGGRSYVQAYGSIDEAYNAAKFTSSLSNVMNGKVVVLLSSGEVAIGNKNNTIGVVIDCAGYSLKFPYTPWLDEREFNSSSFVTFLNASSVTTPRLTRSGAAFINCSTVTVSEINANTMETYESQVHIYECGSSLTLQSVYPNLGGAFFYCGGPYSTSFGTNYKVYGGKFKNNPKDYLATGDLEAVLGSDGNYIVQEKKKTVNVAQIGSTSYETLQIAIDNAKEDDKIVLISDIELDSPVVVSEGKKITIELAGKDIVAQNGAIVNNGTLKLEDSTNYTEANSVSSEAGDTIVNNGVLEITYGDKTSNEGTILLNSGEFIVHNATFNGSIRASEGVDSKAVSNIRGGKFKTSVSSFLKDGYIETLHDGYYYVGMFPYAYASETTISGAEKAWSITGISNDDRNIFVMTSENRDEYTDAQWYRKAELKSMIYPFSERLVDCVVVFNNPVKAGTVQFYVPSLPSPYNKIQLDRDLKANEKYRVLSTQIAVNGNGMKQITYERFLKENQFKTLTVGIQNLSGENDGTTCTIECELFRQTGTGFVTEHTLASVSYPFPIKTVDIALPAVENATWVYKGETVTGSITVDKGTDVELTLKAADGYQFADGATSMAVKFDNLSENITVDNSAFSGVAAPNFTVAKIGSTGYTSLATAISAANANDTIELAATEIAFDATVTINKPITIKGASVAKARSVSAGGTILKFDIASSAFVITSSGVTFKDLTIEQGTKDNSSHISISKGAWDAPKIQYKDILIENVNFVGGDNALFLIGENVVVENSTFTDQDSHNIVIYSLKGESAITGNTFNASKGSNKSAILWEGGADNATDLSGFIGGGNLVVSGNTANAKGVFFQFTNWGLVKDASIQITGNTIDAFSNKAIALYDMDGAVKASGDEFRAFEVKNNAFTNVPSGRPILKEYTATVEVEASENYLGSAEPDYDSLIVGEKVVVNSYYAEPELETLVTIQRGLAGSGRVEDPFVIDDVEDLKLFRDSVNAGETKYNAPGVYVALGANIDMAGVDWSVNIGDDCNATFDGIFDGMNHTIYNLTSTETTQKSDGYICTGLFGAIYDSAQIKNLTLENVTINVGDYTGNNVGALVGFAYNCSGSIDNVTVKNVAINAANATGVGAIVGYDYYSPALKITDCTVDGTSISAASYVGGVIGYASTKVELNNNTVKNLTIDGTASVGGVAGIMLAGGSASGNAIEKVLLAANGAMWANSVGLVAGTITSGSVSVTGTTVTDCEVKDIVGGILVEKPASPIEKVQAKIGDKYYTTLTAAISAATADDTITLVSDVTLTETLKINSDKVVTLDLNGYAVDGREKVRIAIMSYGDLTIKDSSDAKSGAVKAGMGTAGNTVNICGGSFVLESGNIYSLNNAILVDEQSASVEIKGGTITAEPNTGNSAAMYIPSTSDTEVKITGGSLIGYNGILLWNNTKIDVSGGSITATGGVAIQGNGSKDNTEISISGDPVISGYYAAIYHPQGGKLSISGGQLSGWTGVVVKGGNVTIAGGSISGTGAANAYAPVNSGYVDTGDALYVEHYDNSADSENYGTPVVTVTGGTFTSENGKAIGNYANPNNVANGVTKLTKYVSGGTFSDPVEADCCVEGFAPVKVGDKYSVGALPDADVTNLGAITVGKGEYTADSYLAYDLINNSGLSEAKVPYDLTLAMDFKAKDTAEQAAANKFGGYTTDFFIKMEGMSEGSFVGDGCYLAGYYPSFKAWVKIPLDGFTVENGKVYPVITSAGFDFKYTDICSIVGEFICGIYLTPEVLAANPNLKVNLTLGLSENMEAALNAQFEKVDGYVYDADDLMPVELPKVEVVDIKSSLTDSDPDLTFALNFKIKDMNSLTDEYLEKLFAKYGDYYTDYVLTISGLTDPNGSVKFNANGNGDGYLAGQYDAWSKSWVTVPFSDVTVKNGQSFYIMEYAAELMNKGGLRLTLKEIAEIVKNFDCGVYFTPEFLAANPNLKVDLELKVFTEDESGNKVGDISVATNTFDKKDFSVAAVVADDNQPQYYISLAEAVAAAKDGETVVVLSDIVLGSTVKVPAGNQLVLDLNGKTIDGTGKVRIAIMSYGDLTIKDSSEEKTGVVKAGINTAGNCVNICAGSFTLESGNIYSLNNGILIDEEAATVTINGGKITAEPGTNNSAAFYISSASETIVNIAGGELVGYNGILLWNNTKLNITGGSIDAQGRLAIQGNGSRDNTEIAISGNAKITGREAAIYHPQGGKLTISGGEVTGETGVIVKGGNVTICGGTITATGAAGAYEPVSSGFKGTGDALYVEHYDNSANSENYGTPTVTITGGTFVSANGQAVASYANPNGDVEALEKFISGGTFATKPNADYCAEGFTPVKVAGGYSVGILPDAEVMNLGSITVGLGDYKADAYMMYDIINGGKLQEATVPYDLTLAMDFKAKDTAAEAAQNAFGNYTTDFFITMSGMSQASFVGDGCYLAGYYPNFKAWVKIPLDGFKVENGKVYPVITSAGFDFKYTDICGTVGQFICGIYLTPEVLAANPNLSVDLTLGLAENKDAALNAQFLKVDNYIYDADDLQPVTLPEVVIADIKSTLTDADPDLTFALNFAIKDADKLSEEYLEKLFAKYGDYYTDYVLTISGLTDPNGSVKFNANGNGDGYLAGQYDAWSKSWVTVPFSDVTVKNGQSFYIMEYAAELMNKGGLRLTLKEIAEIVKNFDCGVYFTPEFLAANPNLKVDLELKVFTEDENGNKVGDISVATNTFDKDDFSVEAAKLDIRIVNGKPQIGFAGEGKLVLNAATALTGEWTKNVEYTAVENDGDDTKTWVTPKDGYYFFKGYIVR